MTDAFNIFAFVVFAVLLGRAANPPHELVGQGRRDRQARDDPLARPDQ
jgi:hypothetical protein